MAEIEKDLNSPNLYWQTIKDTLINQTLTITAMLSIFFASAYMSTILSSLVVGVNVIIAAARVKGVTTVASGLLGLIITPYTCYKEERYPSKLEYFQMLLSASTTIIGIYAIIFSLGASFVVTPAIIASYLIVASVLDMVSIITTFAQQELKYQALKKKVAKLEKITPAPGNQHKIEHDNKLANAKEKLAELKSGRFTKWGIIGKAVKFIGQLLVITSTILYFTPLAPIAMAFASIGIGLFFAPDIIKYVNEKITINFLIEKISFAILTVSVVLSLVTPFSLVASLGAMLAGVLFVTKKSFDSQVKSTLEVVDNDRVLRHEVSEVSEKNDVNELSEVQANVSSYCKIQAKGGAVDTSIFSPPPTSEIKASEIKSSEIKASEIKFFEIKSSEQQSKETDSDANSFNL